MRLLLAALVASVTAQGSTGPGDNQMNSPPPSPDYEEGCWGCTVLSQYADDYYATEMCEMIPEQEPCTEHPQCSWANLCNGGATGCVPHPAMSPNDPMVNTPQCTPSCAMENDLQCYCTCAACDGTTSGGGGE